MNGGIIMIDEGLIKELETITDTSRIQEIVDQINITNNTKNIAPLLEELQEINNKLYQQHKDSLAPLDLQCYINTLRNQYDITDPREIIHYDNGRGYVQ